MGQHHNVSFRRIRMKWTSLGFLCSCGTNIRKLYADMLACYQLTRFSVGQKVFVLLIIIIKSGSMYYYIFNTLRLKQHGSHFADDTFKRIFLNENVIILIKISLKFVPKGPFDNIPALVKIMAWCLPGDKPLSEAMMVSLLTHICVTRPQWVNQMICFYFEWDSICAYYHQQIRIMNLSS